MSKIAIIGSGVSGLLAGLGLLKQGHDVTIYSALSAEDWLTKGITHGNGMQVCNVTGSRA